MIEAKDRATASELLRDAFLLMEPSRRKSSMPREGKAASSAPPDGAGALAVAAPPNRIHVPAINLDSTRHPRGSSDDDKEDGDRFGKGILDVPDPLDSVRLAYEASATLA